MTIHSMDQLCNYKHSIHYGSYGIIDFNWMKLLIEKVILRF